MKYLKKLLPESIKNMLAKELFYLKWGAFIGAIMTFGMVGQVFVSMAIVLLVGSSIYNYLPNLIEIETLFSKISEIYHFYFQKNEYISFESLDKFLFEAIELFTPYLRDIVSLMIITFLMTVLVFSILNTLLFSAVVLPTKNKYFRVKEPEEKIKKFLFNFVVVSLIALINLLISLLNGGYSRILASIIVVATYYIFMRVEFLGFAIVDPNELETDKLQKIVSPSFKFIEYFKSYLSPLNFLDKLDINKITFYFKYSSALVIITVSILAFIGTKLRFSYDFLNFLGNNYFLSNGYGAEIKLLDFFTNKAFIIQTIKGLIHNPQWGLEAVLYVVITLIFSSQLLLFLNIDIKGYKLKSSGSLLKEISLVPIWLSLCIILISPLIIYEMAFWLRIFLGICIISLSFKTVLSFDKLGFKVVKSGNLE